MVFQDGYFYQRRLFYSTKWSKETEATFVAFLVEHKKHDNFKRNGVNFHAVMSAIYDVNKDHCTRHSYATGDNKLRKLKERYVERVLGKCYVNAYEDFYESLCILFDADNPDEETLVTEDEEVDDSPLTFYNNIMLAHIHKLDTTSVDSTSLWRFLEEYYTSDEEDEVNSLLAVPAAPPPSPDPSYVSVEHTSSSASNEINKSD
ncbi:hypothetical protein Salat_1863200 [Sesamum alatum]|uniref:Uncharacterized protein n=1 Tax=Sesamum alatum TaxID=300844 RepID=A0AAE2CHY6_9LAMI|nr:hypothetical protein Salat_1863200 [Sesamum alatum]